MMTNKNSASVSISAERIALLEEEGMVFRVPARNEGQTVEYAHAEWDGVCYVRRTDKSDRSVAYFEAV